MRLTCPQCQAEIPAADVNIQAGIAKCSRCNWVFSFADKLGAAPGAWTKRQVEMPKCFTLDNSGADLVLVRRWFSPKYVGLLLFCVFWDGFLVVWYSIAFAKHGPLAMKLFPLIHVAVGAGLTYATVAGLLNRTWIRVSPSELSIRHGPVPWPGGRALARQEIDQLFCSESVSRSNNGTSVSYSVNLLRPGGDRLALLSGLDTPEQALFIEQKVEGFMGIQDRPVTGEMR